MQWKYWITSGLVGAALMFSGVAIAVVDSSNDKTVEKLSSDDATISGVNNIEETNKKTHKDEEGTLHVSEEVKDTIAEAHGTMNELVGGDRIYDFKGGEIARAEWEATQEDRESVHEAVKGIIEETEGDVQDDFENADHLLEQATENFDYKALRNAHRILHDLDNIMNDYEKERFGVTNTAGNDSEIEKVLD